MAGGIGSRFWPASRSSHPKQLLDLTGSGQTMIAATVARLTPLIPPQQVFVITSQKIRDAVSQELPDVPGANIIAEPAGRNTAPCIGLAALIIRRIHPEAVMAVMPSDHLVKDIPSFQRAMTVGIRAAAGGNLVTFGIRPSSPETGFGYIETGDEAAPGVRTAVRFVEKPSLELAQTYLRSGNFVWNSGMFFFKATAILNEIQQRLPELFQGLSIIDQAIGTPEEAAVIAAVFPTLPSVSIDYGIMEKADGIHCVPVDFGWSDLGSFEAAWDRSEKNAQGNALAKEHIAIDSHNCFVRAPAGKIVALVGLDDVVVVDTGDALLICRKDRAQDVRHVVSALASSGRDDLL
jgi:mannose-1-phosphate guanylyltransferase